MRWNGQVQLIFHSTFGLTLLIILHLFGKFARSSRYVKTFAHRRCIMCSTLAKCLVLVSTWVIIDTHLQKENAENLWRPSLD